MARYEYCFIVCLCLAVKYASTTTSTATSDTTPVVTNTIDPQSTQTAASTITATATSRTDSNTDPTSSVGSSIGQSSSLGSSIGQSSSLGSSTGQSSSLDSNTSPTSSIGSNTDVTSPSVITDGGATLKPESTTQGLICFDITCDTSDDCITIEASKDSAKKCFAVAGGSCFLSKENTVYTAGCTDTVCEWGSIIANTGQTKITNCCTEFRCNSDLKLLQDPNSATNMYLHSIFVVLVAFHVFKCLF